MQLNSSYLYPNKIDVYTNLESWTKERYFKVYQRPYKLYRGVDNRLDLQIRNADQKPKNIVGLTVVFNILVSESNELLKQFDCHPLDPSTGKFFVVISEADMLEFEKGLYNFSIYTINSQGVKTPLYGDSQHSALGEIRVEGDVYPEPKESEVIDIFNLENEAYFSSVVDAKPQFNSNSALHTLAFYFNEYTGLVTIQGSLDDSTNPLGWVDIKSFDLENSGITYKNITGVWSHLRIKHKPTNGTIDKVLYRY